MIEAANPLGDEARRKLVRASVLFRDANARAVDRLVSMSGLRHLQRGEILFTQGDEGDGLYAVHSGLVRIWLGSSSGKELTLGLMEPGDVIGEIALLDGLPRTANAVAAEDTILLAIRRETFLALIREEPQLGVHVIELLCERLRRNTDMLGEFAFRDVRSRLANKLVELATGHGHSTPQGTEIRLRLSQSELASMLGATREAVNKQLAAWAHQEIVAVERGRIVLCDLGKLRQLASDGGS